MARKPYLPTWRLEYLPGVGDDSTLLEGVYAPTQAAAWAEMRPNIGGAAPDATPASLGLRVVREEEPDAAKPSRRVPVRLRHRLPVCGLMQAVAADLGLTEGQEPRARFVYGTTRGAVATFRLSVAADKWLLPAREEAVDLLHKALFGLFGRMADHPETVKLLRPVKPSSPPTTEAPPMPTETPTPNAMPTPLNLSRAERERIGISLRNDAHGLDDADSDETAGDGLRLLAAKVDPWHDANGNPIKGNGWRDTPPGGSKQTGAAFDVWGGTEAEALDLAGAHGALAQDRALRDLVNRLKQKRNALEESGALDRERNAKAAERAAKHKRTPPRLKGLERAFADALGPDATRALGVDPEA